MYNRKKFLPRGWSIGERKEEGGEGGGGKYACP